MEPFDQLTRLNGSAQRIQSLRIPLTEEKRENKKLGYYNHVISTCMIKEHQREKSKTLNFLPRNIGDLKYKKQQQNSKKKLNTQFHT